MAIKPPASGQKAKTAEDHKFTRGLQSIEDARADRRKRKFMPPRFWLWAMVFIGAGIIVW